MITLADLPIEPNVIIVFAMVIFAAVKAFLEKKQTGGEVEPPPLNEAEEIAPYEQYEAELQRQRAEMEMPLPIPQSTPPPLTPATFTPNLAPQKAPPRPTLSTAEKEALQNLQLVSPSKRRRQGNKFSTRYRVQKLVSSPTAAREALLLADILGPPKALKSEDQI